MENATKNSSIINISSFDAINGGELSIYSALKAGMITMTKSASLESGQYVLGIYLDLFIKIANMYYVCSTGLEFE